jgi:four helix bundle protein
MVQRVQDLDLYKRAKAAAIKIFEASKRFPADEKYSLTDQIRRSSRAVAANLSEAWRRRPYPASFVSRLNDAEAEAGETQTWVEFAVSCHYLGAEEAADAWREYDEIIAQLVAMANNPDLWCRGVSRRDP